MNLIFGIICIPAQGLSVRFNQHLRFVQRRFTRKYVHTSLVRYTKRWTHLLIYSSEEEVYLYQNRQTKRFNHHAK